MLDQASASVEFVSATGWNEDKLQNQVLQSLQRPFDLASGSVVRMSVFSCTPTNHIVLLAVHRIACDGCSLLVLMDELLKVYQALKNNIVINLPSLVNSYQEYVQRELNLLNSPQGEQFRHELKQRFGGELPILNLPMSHPRLPIRTYRGALYKLSISSDLTSKLKHFAQTEDVELSTVLLAAFQVILHRYTASEDILVGLNADSGKQQEFNNVVGNFANLAVVRSSISSSVSFQQLLSLIRDAVSEAIAHQDYPFPLLVRQLQLNSQQSHPPICQVGLTYQNLVKLDFLSTLFGKTNSSVSYYEILEQKAEFDLS